MKAFLIENQALLAFGLVWLIATLMAAHRAWYRGYEAACRSFASHALTQTRSQTSERI